MHSVRTLRLRVVSLSVSCFALAACTASPPIPTLEAPVEVRLVGARPTAPIATGARPVTEPEVGKVSCVDAEREVRRTHARAIPLVRAEHQGLVRLLESTAAASPDWDLLALRLGDIERELAALDPTNARIHRSSAERHYRSVSSRQGATMPEALYRLGIDAECEGDFMSARKLYFELVQKAPKSRLIPYAYFAFGEMFLHESDEHPERMPLARQAFIKASELNASPIAALAKRRLAEHPAEPEPEPEPEP